MTSACPNAERWQTITQGQLSDAEFTPLLAHLESCPSCSQRLRSLPRDETIEGPLGQGTVVDEPVPEIVVRLMDRLKKMPVVCTTNEVTVNDQELSATIVPQAAELDEITQEVYGFLESAQAPDELGRLGGYRVLKLLGSGGMGAVFLAEDVHLQRQVALKVMRPGVAANPQAHDRFLREARACAALKHDNIVTIYQVGEERGVPFLAMEFLQGMPLDALLDSNRRLTVPEILRIGREITCGLAAAHEKGLIHRDIKPANIWLEGESERVKILDFGLARTSTENVNLTQSGTIVGTPAYMAPEQARGEKVDGRTDLFSLGAVLYRICAGRNPFTGANMMAVLTSLALDTPKPVAECNPETPPALASLIERLMAKDPAGRPESAKAVVAEIQAIERSLAVPATKPVPRPAPGRARRWVAALVAAAVLGTLSVVLALTVFRVDTDNGTLVVEIDDPNVQVVLRQNGVVVQDGTTKREFTLKAGEGELIVTDRDGVTLTTKAFTIRRNDKEVVSVKLEGRAAVKPPVGPAIVGGPSPFDSLRREAIPVGEITDEDGRQAPKELVAVLGSRRFNHLNEIFAVAYRPDGKQIASAGSNYDPRIRLWDSGTGVLQAAWELSPERTLSLAYSPNGKTLAVGRKSITMYRVEDGTKIGELKGLGRSVGHLLYSTDGKRLFSAGHGWGNEPGEVIAWDLETGKELWKVSVEKDGLSGFALSPDGKTLTGASDLWKGVVVLWDAETGKELRQIEFPEGQPSRLAFDPQGKHLAVNVQKSAGEIRVLDLATGKTVRSFPIKGNSYALCYSPNGRWIASQSDQAQVTVWEAGTGEVVKTLATPPIASAGQLVFRPDGGELVLGSRMGGIITWETAGWTSTWSTRGHCGQVRAVDVSPDGKWIASGGNDGTVRVWDATSGKLISTWFLDDYVKNVVFSPDGSCVAGASHHGVRVWDRATGRVLYTSSLTLDNGSGIAFSPDGSRLALANGVKVAVLDAANGKLLGTPFEVNVGAITDLKWSRDGRFIGMRGVTIPCGLLEVATGKVTALNSKNKAAFESFSPDGRWILGIGWILGTRQKRATFWDVTTNEEVFPWGAQPSPAFQMAFSPDGTRVALMTSRGITVRNAANGEVQAELAVAQVESMAFAPDGRHLVVAHTQGTVTVYRLADAKRPTPVVGGASPLDSLRREAIPEGELTDEDGWPAPKELVAILGGRRFNHRHAANTLAYRPDGKQIASAGTAHDQKLRLWDANTGVLQALYQFPPPNADTYSLAYSPDGKTLAVGRRGISLHRVEDGKKINELAVLGRYVGYLQYSTDGKRLFSASTNVAGTDPGQVVAWNLENGKEIWKVPVEVNGLYGFALSPDGKILAGTSKQWNNVVVLWDAETGKEIRRIEGIDKSPTQLAFAPQGEHLAVVVNGDEIRILDLATGKKVRSFRTKPRVVSLCYSPDGRWIASLNNQQEATVWEAGTGTLVKTLATPPATDGQLVFRPDGGELALASSTGGVITWETEGWTSTWPARGHCGTVLSVDISADGKWIASGGDDGTAQVWDTTSGKQISTWVLDDRVRTVVFSPDSTYVAGACPTGVRVWDRATGRVLYTNKVDMGYSAGLAFSPDGSRLAFATSGNIAVLDAASGKLLGMPFETKAGTISNLKWSQDGRSIGIQGSIITCGVLEVATGKFTELTSKYKATFESFSPDGRWILGIGWMGRQKRATFWDATTKEETFPWGEQVALVGRAVFSSDGKRVALWTSKGITVRNAADGKVQTELAVTRVESMAFAPDGRHLVVAHTQGTVTVYRLADAKGPTPVPAVGKSACDALQRDQIDPEEAAVIGDGDVANTPKELVGVIGSTRLTTHEKVVGIAFRPGGHQLAMSHVTAEPIALCDTRTGRRTGQIDKLGILTAMAYSPDGKTLALGGPPKSLFLVNPDDSRTKRSLEGHQSSISAIRYSPDSKRLFSASGRSQTKDDTFEIIAWDVESGAVVWKVPVEKPGVSDLAISQDGKTLFALFGGADIHVLDSSNGKEIRKITGHKEIGQRLEVNSATGHLIVARTPRYKWQLQILDGESGKELHQQTFENKFLLACSPDGKWLAVTVGEKTLLFDARLQRVREFPGVGNYVPSLAFSPDGAILAVGQAGGGAVLWNVASGERHWPDESHTSPVDTASVSGDGTRLVTTGADSTIRVWNIGTGKMERTLKMAQPMAAEFIPGCDRIVGVSNREMVVFDAKTGKEQWKITREGKAFAGVAVNPDGTRILTRLGTQLCVLDAETGKEVLLTEAIATASTKELAWSPDSKWIAADNVMPIDATTGKSAFEPKGNNGRYGITFSPDSRYFLVSQMTHIDRWDLKTGQMVPLFRNGGAASLEITRDGRRLVCLKDWTRKLTVLDPVTGETQQVIALPKAPQLYKASSSTAMTLAPDGRHVIIGDTLGVCYIYRLADVP